MISERLANGLRRAIVRFDGFMRGRLGVYEFCDDPDCLLRIRVMPAPHTIILPDTTIAKHAPVIEIHLWNERIPPVPPDGLNLRWAHRLQRLFIGSYHCLGQQMRHDPRLADVQAVGGFPAMLSPRNHPAAIKLVERWGFLVVPYHRRLGRFGEFWENLFSWWIMWAFNPASQRGRSLFYLQRMEIWISAQEFLRRYGEAPLGD